MLLDDFAATEVTEIIAGNTEALFSPIQNVIRQNAAVGVAEQTLQFIPVIPDVFIQREREFNQAARDLRHYRVPVAAVGSSRRLIVLLQQNPCHYLRIFP